MKINIKLLFLFSLCFYGLITLTGFEIISDEYLSPEHIYFDRIRAEVYIGLATYPGVAVYDTKSEKTSHIIPMPSSVRGLTVNDNILYVAAGQSAAMLYVYDLEEKKIKKSIPTGHGPSEIAFSNSSGLLFVANRFSNDVSVIDLKNHKEIKRLEAIREPVALALSPDEKLLAVTNLLPSQPSIGKNVSAEITLIDTEKLIVVKNVSLPNGTYAVKDIVFSHDGKFIYATHLTGRFNVLTNQIEKGWINTNALSIIDTETKELYTTVLLDDIYKGAANPNGLNISEDGKILYVAISGSHELYVIDREGMHRRIESTKDNSDTSQTTEPVAGIDDKILLFEASNKLEPLHVLFEDIPNELSFLSPVGKRIKLIGKGPSHIVDIGDDILVTSYFSDGIDIVSFQGETIKTDFVEIGSKDISLSEERYGEMLFHDAESCFQQWQSCASCHPGDGRVDGLNWDLMNDGIGNPKNTKSLLFSHRTPPAMATGIRKDAETCVRAGFKFIQFFDAPEESAQAVDAYLKSLKPVPSPYLVDGQLSESAYRGKNLFEANNCNKCHSGPLFTNLQQYEMGVIGKYDKQNTWDTPTLIEIWRTAPYLHDGKYSSMEDVFHLGKHGLKEPLSELEIKDLTEYLLSL